MSFLNQFYETAAAAGFLEQCLWCPSDGSPPQTYPVHFTAADNPILDGLTLNTEYWMTYPDSIFRTLRAPEAVEINERIFLVREVRAIGDGSEMRATLTKI